MARIDEVGRGNFRIFRIRPDDPFPWGGIIVLGVVVLLIASCAA